MSARPLLRAPGLLLAMAALGLTVALVCSGCVRPVVKSAMAAQPDSEAPVVVIEPKAQDEKLTVPVGARVKLFLPLVEDDVRLYADTSSKVVRGERGKVPAEDESGPWGTLVAQCPGEVEVRVDFRTLRVPVDEPTPTRQWGSLMLTVQGEKCLAPAPAAK